MTKTIITLILTILGTTLFAQDKTADELKTLFNNKQYEKIIKEYAPKSADYSARALYYVGFAYYMKEEDDNCLKYMDLSIAKDSKDPAPYYIKGSTLNYMNKYKDAIKELTTAISLKPDDAEFYSRLGDSYYNLEKYDLALETYKKATEQADCPGRPYSMIGQIYTDQNNNDKALEAYYLAKSKIATEEKTYINAVFNIGLLESLKGNYEKAEPAFLEIIKLDPEDYHTYAKLIQIYYHRKEYDLAKPYKDLLYAAYKKGVLKDNMKDMFCFDQFKWNDYLVLVFERFEEGNKANIYNKHIFYVQNEKQDLILRVQTEFSPIAVELGEAKYMLCATKGSTHYNSGLGFNDDFKYDVLKAQAIKMMEKHIK